VRKEEGGDRGTGKVSGGRSERGNGSGRHMKGRASDIFSAGAGGVWLNGSTET
jgi:hypothetical protein